MHLYLYVRSCVCLVCSYVHKDISSLTLWTLFLSLIDIQKETSSPWSVPFIVYRLDGHLPYQRQRYSYTFTTPVSNEAAWDSFQQIWDNKTRKQTALYIHLGYHLTILYSVLHKDVSCCSLCLSFFAGLFLYNILEKKRSSLIHILHTTEASI